MAVKKLLLCAFCGMWSIPSENLIIDNIPDQFIESLDRIGTTNHQSRAALIREAIADFLKVKSLPPSEAAFGIWKSREMDGVEYQNELREEWEGR